MLHPAIRILTLIALASALPVLSLIHLLIVLATIAGAFMCMARASLPQLFDGMLRLRWLLLAILIVYWGFTPGEPLLDAAPGLSREGVSEGIRRVLVLLGLLMAVYLLIARTTVPQLISGLQLLTAPFALIGFQPQAFAARMGLALDQVSRAEQMLRQAREQQRESLIAAAAAAISATEAQAQMAAPDLTTVTLAAPRLWEWLIPLGLGLGLHGLAT